LDFASRIAVVNQRIETRGRRHFFVPRGKGAVTKPESIEQLVAAMGEDADDALRMKLAALAADMEEGGTDRREPVREIFGLLGDRWCTLILLVLATGRYRHAALRRTINFLGQEDSISQRVLTLKLRALERNGLIARRASDDVPPRVDYALTGLGVELAQRARSLIDWIKTRHCEIEDARVAFARTEHDKLY
jgi:DNA-binding HxlR family transcriptional regulator